MRKPVVLITGAGGEIGHGLLARLSDGGTVPIITLDVNPLDPPLARLVTREFVGSITDGALLDRILAEFEVDRVFHLAALLSTRAEFTPVTAHHVNVEGTLNLLEFAQRQGESHGRPVTFIYPSSIAAFGLPSLEAKTRAGRLSEDEHTHPQTMYGCNKLYCEHVGRYFMLYARQLGQGTSGARIDFRSIRFPGLISADNAPTGGTSDFGPGMIHAAASNTPYSCFVRPDARIPFMATPDAVRALIDLANADRERLTTCVYNIGAFSLSAAQIADRVKRSFPAARIDYEPDPVRTAIVASWPEDVDDTRARTEWGWEPRYPWDRAFDEYLVPNITARYAR